jgi:hypothetical protein
MGETIGFKIALIFHSDQAGSLSDPTIKKRPMDYSKTNHES